MYSISSVFSRELTGTAIAPRFETREVSQGKFDRVVHVERNSVALVNPLCLKTPRQPGCLLIELSVGQRRIAADQRRLTRQPLSRCA